MERFDLKNGALRLTEHPGLAYRVETGRVLVFLMPWREKKTGRRFPLAEVGPGALVPSLCWEDDVQGSWIFGLSALEEASLTCWEAPRGSGRRPRSPSPGRRGSGSWTPRPSPSRWWSATT